jgi:hypothetical protein
MLQEDHPRGMRYGGKHGSSLTFATPHFKRINQQKIKIKYHNYYILLLL